MVVISQVVVVDGFVFGVKVGRDLVTFNGSMCLQLYARQFYVFSGFICHFFGVALTRQREVVVVIIRVPATCRGTVVFYGVCFVYNTPGGWVARNVFTVRAIRVQGTLADPFFVFGFQGFGVRRGSSSAVFVVSL